MFNPLFPLDGLTDQFISECPVCKSKKDFLEISLIEGENENDKHLIHLKCQKCYTKLVGVVSLTPMGASIISFIVDLEKDEVAKFKRNDRVNEDDLIDLHQTLKNDKINFLEIIK